MFTFFLQGYRKGLLDFCGSSVEIEFDPSKEDGKFCFRKYDNGEYKPLIPSTKHSNILKGVIVGKKSWGLWTQQWSEGIVDWSFTKEEILSQFKSNSIKIPEPLLKDFENVINKKKIKRNEEYLKQLKY
jgi:hypothetical protein